MDNIYVKGSTSVIVQVLLRDSASASAAGKTGLTNSTVSAYYCRPGGTSTIINLIAGSAGDSYSSGKFAEVDSVNMPGLYQVHLPVGCLATGANSVVVYYSGSGMITTQQKVILNDADLRNAVSLGLSLVPCNAIEIGGTNVSGIQSVVLGSDNKMLVSADAQDLSATFHVDAKLLGGATPNNLAAGAKMDIIDVPNPTAVAAFKTAFADLSVSIHQILGTTLTESLSGQIEAAFKYFFDVSSPTLTMQNINQTGDTFSKFMSLFFSHFGTAQGGGANFIQLDLGASASDDAYRHYKVAITAGPGAGEQGYVLYYTGSTRTAVIDHPWVVPPTGSSSFVIVEYVKDQLISTSGLAQAGAASSITLAASDTAADNARKGEVVVINSGTAKEQKRIILSNSFATKIAVVDRPWDIQPDSTSVYITYNLDQNLTNGLFDSGIDLTTTQKTSTQTADQAAMTAQGFTLIRAPKLDELDAAVSSRAVPGDKMDLVNVPNATAIAAFKTGLAGLGTYITGLLSTALTESSVGQIEQAFKLFFDVALPVLTTASVNQGADNNVILNNGTYGNAAIETLVAAINAIVSSGSYGNAALLTAIQNVQNGTFVSATVPSYIETPAAGSVAVTIVVVFYNEMGVPTDLDSLALPTTTLVNDAGANLGSRLSIWTHITTGQYSQVYTNGSADAQEGTHWTIDGTLNGHDRKYVQYMQIVNDIASTFTPTDRTNLGLVKVKTDQLAFTVTNQVDANSLATAAPTDMALNSTVAKEANVEGHVGNVVTQQYIRNSLAGFAATVTVVAGSTDAFLSDLETKTNNKIVWEYTGGAYTGKVFLRNNGDTANYAYSFARDPATLALLTDPAHKGPVNFDPWTLI